MHFLRAWAFAGFIILSNPMLAHAQADSREPCKRPSAGSVVAEPEDLRSKNGILNVELTIRSSVDAEGRIRYCYLARDGSEAPNIRVKSGDWLVLKLRNDIDVVPTASAHSMDMGSPGSAAGACTKMGMTAVSTNLHFHGLTVPPVCHQDDVMKTIIQPGDAPFEYRFQIPRDEPPGLYWYHPHVHGFTSPQVLGGASGALIVEGIERANRQLANLPERVFVIRDQDLLNPTAAPVSSDSMPAPLVLRDAEGDILNNGTGTGKPAKDLSINFVPVSYPNYSPAMIKVKPSEKQLWRVLNASAITYLDLQVLVDGAPQLLGVVSIDGIPLSENGTDPDRIIWESHLALPPAGRVEFIFKGLPEGAQGSFVTRSVDTGPAGENDPTRPLAKILAAQDASEPRSRFAASPLPLPPPSSVWIGNVAPAHTRKLYFSEQQQDPSDPNSPTKFFVTVEGQTPAVFDPNATMPNITVQQGDVEDWVIENRSRELHAFHIHQIHFMLIGWNGVPIDEPFLRDTINVPYWDGRSPQYPSVKLRMDFRDPNAVGTFVYHCHLLEHEDGGMMGSIRVQARPARH
jgi:FtsP/CotA-like multicopper oxidase with cupredoxin domain